MPDSLGYIVKWVRVKTRLTQLAHVVWSGLDRSASYISSLETNKTSPTLQEMEALAVIYGTTVFDMLSEAKGISPNWDFTPNPDIRLLLNFYESLNSERRKIALEFIQYLAEKQKMERYNESKRNNE